MDTDIDLGFGLEDSVALITGAGGQIGRVIVAAFLQAGCKVAALDRDKTKFDIQHERLFWFEVDTTDERQVIDAWTKVEDHFSAVPTVCVCAAALDLSFVPRHDSITTLPVEQFRRTLDVVSTLGLPLKSSDRLRLFDAERHRDIHYG
jgi:NAD(P)-dependent dehydrogenase (short-subunit alcohol dehydrogenase family)